MQPSRANLKREQSHAEEIANSSSHAIGLLAALIGTPVLIVHAVRQDDAAFIVGVIIFAATVLLLYLASTLYHALPAGKAKRVFRVLDHSSIFLLIAGTYAPFSLGVLRGAWGWTLFGLVWSIAVAGIVFKAVGKASHPVLSTGLYLLMGWLVVIAVDPMVTRVPLSGLLWLLAGGVFYTAGVVFYATDSRLQYGHFAWHLFVMAGTACHYFAVLWYAA
ncbi:hemolysin III family protein [Methyloversatilis sp.]|uniref:PAQR family membrane homeostasis protein TrhA n=1 Tax=Methyloversatilis sp. TaxID=2569862 RepID=UPI0027334409|nr:hemolysin III family protein [Methyloversatilis sp.]MDP2867306.1 hemolysin III family protein [Methyloversatilis sp.]MDP3454229.1 hemolysin III family protein [Methyloversatilis sp.]MDP3579871.1 hemolysin III family protein [Methyloversatilis sp.]